MKRRSSDMPLTFALCASLLAHGILWVVVLREKVAYLTSQMIWPAPAAEAHADKSKAEDAAADAAGDAEAPGTIIQTQQQTVAELQPAPLPPPPEPPRPKKPKTVNDENSEWGEKDGQGFAINSAPGKQPMAARKGLEDQSFASRDPEGPQPFPEEPSMSTVRPGENGDGRKPVRDALAGKGTEGNPAVVIGGPETPAVPPPPVPLPKPAALARVDDESATPQNSGASASVMPAPEKRSPADGNSPPAERDALYNGAGSEQLTQILPIKRTDVIGIRSNAPAYPDVVEALTRPPGVKLSPPDAAAPLAEAVLPNLAAPDVSASPQIQAATAAIGVPPRKTEEMSRLVGEWDPLSGPAVVEALTHPPGATAAEGGAAPLPELARADEPAAPSVENAIIAMQIEEPKPLEPARLVEPAVAAAAEQVVVATRGQVGSAASATGGLPGPPTEAADPAPDTGLESDPFAKIPSVDFRNGEVQARSGRQVKPVRPRLTEAGRRDLLAMQFPTILCKVRIDKAGKVTDVRVVQGSGSEAIDMPVYRCLWGWYFEPPKDKKGNALEDVQLVAIHWG